MARRFRTPRDPVTVTLDGAPVVAERGEPLAVSLVGGDRLALARSAKFHRPRGVSCLRGGCDGCLARVDGVPNVMTCRVPAADGAEILTQNTLGSREVDLLRMTDWFFPRGINHHELMAGVPWAQQVMQAFAHRVAGLGKLPSHAGEQRPAIRREVAVLVIGAGAAGMATAVALAERGLDVEVVDDALAAGGGLLAFNEKDRAIWGPLFGRFARAVQSGKVRLRLQTLAVSIFGDDVVVAGDAGIEVVRPERLVIATGGHDGALAFPGNDLPGIVSARAAGWLLENGVVIGDNVLVAIVSDGTGIGESFARAASEIPGVRVTVARGLPTRARGTTSVRDATVRTDRGDVEMSIDALVIDSPVSPSYELCVQAGAKVQALDTGFLVSTAGGKIRDSVFAVGEVVGTPVTPSAIDEEAARIALYVTADSALPVR